jgi:peptidylprolyl isomerase
MSNEVKDGNTVSIHYTGKLEDGTVFDSSYGRQPFEFTVGSGSVIKGIDTGVMGMNVGDKKAFEIDSDDAYGPHMNELVKDIPREEFPFNPEVGQRLRAETTDGRIIDVTVAAVSPETVTIDANHPLAGKKLFFEVELLGIT